MFSSTPTRPIEPEVLAWAVRGRDVSPVRGDRRGSPALDPLRRAGCRSRRCPRVRRRTWLRIAAGFDHARITRVDRSGPCSAPSPPCPATGWCGPTSRPGSKRRRLRARSRIASSRSIPATSSPAPTAATALRLAAWLNCSWIRAAAAVVADPAAGGFRRFNARVVSGLPLPDRAMADAGPARPRGAGARRDSRPGGAR